MKGRGKRINWTPIALTCLGLGAATGGLALALTQKADPQPAAARLHALGESLQRANERSTQADSDQAEIRTTVNSLRGANQGTPGQNDGVESEPANAVTEGSELDLPEVVVAPLFVAQDSLTDAGAAAGGGDTAALDAMAPPTIGDATPDTLIGDAAIDTATADDLAAEDWAMEASALPQSVEDLPPGADQGLTYCGMATCNVGYKCCCDTCTPFDEPCHAAECNAFTGLSVSMACGMDICEPGEICCDPSCAACSESGLCPEQPCD